MQQAWPSHLVMRTLPLPVTVTVVQLMMKEQIQRVRDMKRLEMSFLY